MQVDQEPHNMSSVLFSSQFTNNMSKQTAFSTVGRDPAYHSSGTVVRPSGTMYFASEVVASTSPNAQRRRGMAFASACNSAFSVVRSQQQLPQAPPAHYSQGFLTIKPEPFAGEMLVMDSASSYGLNPCYDGAPSACAPSLFDESFAGPLDPLAF